MREETKGVIIYDLRKKELIFENELFWLSHNWSNEILENNEISTSESLECNNFDIKIGNKEIIMKMKISKDCDSINSLDTDITKWCYELKNNSFVGKVIKITGNNLFND